MLDSSYIVVLLLVNNKKITTLEVLGTNNTWRFFIFYQPAANAASDVWCVVNKLLCCSRRG